jgi:hypothetical protein
LTAGLAVATGLGRKYVEFATASRPVKLVLYDRCTLAIDAGVSPGGTGSHRLMLGSSAGAFTGPDGFAWQPHRCEPGGAAHVHGELAQVGRSR